MTFWDVCGTVGGIISVFYIILSFFLSKYSLLNFKIEAINILYKLKTKKSKQHDEQPNHISISFVQQLFLLTNFFPKNKLVNFFRKGEEKLNKEMDIIHLIKHDRLWYKDNHE